MSAVTRRSSRSLSQGAEPSGARGRSRSASSSAQKRSSRSTERSPKKRKRSPSFTTEAPAVFKRIVNGRIVDAYCWVCHKLGDESACNSCPRVYHHECLRKIKKNSSNDTPFCECQLKTVDGKNENLNLDVRELKKLLQYVMQEAIKEERKNNQKFHHTENSRFCRLFQAWPSENDNLCKIMDLNILLDNMNGEVPYLNTGQFFLDVKWIYHNCCILYGPDYNITEAALKLEKNFKQELTDMEACPECYYMKYSDNYLHADFFTKVCRKPHTIVWAKLRGSPFWPAKCLKIHNGHADVRFFGTHDKSNIALNKCYKISRENPLNKAIQQPKYKDAIRELSIYVSTYESKIGPFKFYPRKTALQDSIVSMKKSVKKGRNKSSNAEQVDNNEQNSDFTDTKVRVPFIENFPDNERNETVADSVEGVDIDSNVVCHMTFIADEHNGPANELNNSEDIIGSSASQCSLPEASLNPNMSLSSSLEGTTGLLSAAVLPSPSEVEIPTEAENSLSFINVNALPVITSISANEMPLNELPVITSAVSNNEISNETSAGPSTSHSFPVITSTVSANEKENFTSNNIFAQEENDNVPVNEPPTDKSSSIPQLGRSLLSSFMNDANFSHLFENDDDDDEVQVISGGRQNSIAEEYVKNPSIVKAFTEVLLGSRPHMKKSFLAYHNCIMQIFVLMAIDFMFMKFENTDVRNFLEFLKKTLKKYDAVKRALLKVESEKSEADKARLEAIEAKLEAEKARAEAEKAKQKLEEEVKELKKKIESMGQGQFRNQKSELKDMIILKASQKVHSKSENYKASENHFIQEIDSLTMQLTEARQKINIKEEDIFKLREENEKLKSLLIDAKNKTNTCDFGIQTEEIQFESLEKEIEQSDSAFILNQNQESSHILEDSSEASNICQDQQGLTQTEVQVEMQRNMYVIETLSSVTSNCNLNTGVVQQLYEQNVLTSECTTVMAGPSTGVINTAPPTLVPVPVVLPSNTVIPPAGPIFLDEESSATFLNSMNPRKTKAKFSSIAKSGGKRKKKNV